MALSADIHVVSGCWYAKPYWQAQAHPAVIWLDRAFYMPDPEYISLGWLNPDGGRSFHRGTGRAAPVPAERSRAPGTIFLADYNGVIEPAETVRLHPAQEKHTEPLTDALRRHGTAVGYMTTALVTAALQGLQVVCKDDRNIMAQPDWLQLLPFADWDHDEIENGELWAHLQPSLNQRLNRSH